MVVRVRRRPGAADGLRRALSLRVVLINRFLTPLGIGGADLAASCIYLWCLQRVLTDEGPNAASQLSGLSGNPGQQYILTLVGDFLPRADRTSTSHAARDHPGPRPPTTATTRTGHTAVIPSLPLRPPAPERSAPAQHRIGGPPDNLRPAGCPATVVPHQGMSCSGVVPRLPLTKRLIPRASG